VVNGRDQRPRPTVPLFPGPAGASLAPRARSVLALQSLASRDMKEKECRDGAPELGAASERQDELGCEGRARSLRARLHPTRLRRATTGVWGSRTPQESNRGRICGLMRSGAAAGGAAAGVPAPRTSAAGAVAGLPCHRSICGPSASCAPWRGLCFSEDFESLSHVKQVRTKIKKQNSSEKQKLIK